MKTDWLEDLIGPHHVSEIGQCRAVAWLIRLAVSHPLTLHHPLGTEEARKWAIAQTLLAARVYDLELENRIYVEFQKRDWI